MLVGERPLIVDIKQIVEAERCRTPGKTGAFLPHIVVAQGDMPGAAWAVFDVQDGGSVLRAGQHGRLGVVGLQPVHLVEALLDIADIDDPADQAGKGCRQRRVAGHFLAIEIDVGKRAFDDEQPEDPGLGDILLRHVGTRGHISMIDIEVRHIPENGIDLCQADASVAVRRRHLADLLRR